MLSRWLHTTSFSEKVTIFKEYLFLKSFSSEKSTCLKEVPASKKYMFWISTYSEEAAPPK